MSEALFNDYASSGLYYLPKVRRSELQSAAEAAHLHVANVIVSDNDNIESLLTHLGVELGFPEWYGANFDALYDCLTDPDWQTGAGSVIFVDGLEPLRSYEPDDFTTLIDVFRAASEARLAMESPFWILIDTPARGVPSIS